MKNYYEEKVSAIHPLDGRRIHVVFADGYEGNVDLAPLIGRGTLYEPLQAEESFLRVTLDRGVPVWPGDLDLSPGTLRVWCEAGRFLDWEETDRWIAEHISSPEKAA
jgi:hypothetical protein